LPCAVQCQVIFLMAKFHSPDLLAEDSIVLCVAAAEVYPSSVRCKAHGMSAAVGKLGALTPTILFNYISDRTKFWVVCWAGMLGFLVTLIFVPDATGKSSEIVRSNAHLHKLAVVRQDDAEYWHVMCFMHLAAQ